MPAAYDTYNYPSYWDEREYEHASEVIAIKKFLTKIPEIDSLIDIGSGYGRLVSTYVYRIKKIALADPSAKLLSLSRKKYAKYKSKFRFIHSKLENLPGKIRTKYDLAILVRVLHHIEDSDQALEVVCNLLNPRGYLILEFPNKSHFKAVLTEFKKGNFTFPIDIFPKDIRSKRNIKNNTLPFINYHPDVIYKKLEDAGFDIIEVRSVSNFRNILFKNILPIETLLALEEMVQKLFFRFRFGPSIFILARKRS